MHQKRLYAEAATYTEYRPSALLPRFEIRAVGLVCPVVNCLNDFTDVSRTRTNPIGLRLNH